MNYYFVKMDLGLYNIKYEEEKIVFRRRARIWRPFSSFLDVNSKTRNILIPAKNEKDAQDKFHLDIRLRLEKEYGDSYSITSAQDAEEIKIDGYDIIIKQSVKKLINMSYPEIIS